MSHPDFDESENAIPHGTPAMDEAAHGEPHPAPEPEPIVIEPSHEEVMAARLASQPTPLALPAAPQGLDLYSGDGPVDWVEVRRGGRSFAIIKATEGTHAVDPGFVDRFVAMRPAGLVRGAYHFLRPGLDGLAQAQHYLATLKTALDATGDSPAGVLVCVDVERMDGKAPEEVAECVRAFCSHVAEVTGFCPILYTSARFVREDMKGVEFGVAKLAGNHGCPLWIVWWRSGEPTCPPEWGDGNWLLQQKNGDSHEIHGAHQADADTWHVLAQGSKGEPVRFVQLQLGIEDDGDFGPKTDQAVRKFQKDRGLSIDGRVGPVSWTAIAWSRAA